MNPPPFPENPYPQVRNPLDQVLKIDHRGHMRIDYYEDAAYKKHLEVYQKRKKEEQACRAHGSRYYMRNVFPYVEHQCTCWIQREYDAAYARRVEAYRKANAEAAKKDPNHMQRCDTILN
jgi:hypothetical protein